MIRNLTAALLVLSPAFAGTPAFALDPPMLVDEAAQAGVDHRYTGGWEFYVGGGVATFDCSGDGYPELYFAGGDGAASLWLNESSRGGSLAFSRITAPEVEMQGVTGAYPLDFNGDGIFDLAVLRVGANALLQGRGDCRFTLANEALGFDAGQEWTTAFSAIWEEGRTLPTLAMGNYVDRQAPGAPFGTCHDQHIHRPAEESRYGPPTVLRPGYCALSMLFSDWNRDGVPDLRISNDRQYYQGGAEQLIRLPPAGAPHSYSAVEGWRELKIWGMGIAGYDLTGTGYPDYFLTSMADNKLQSLSPDTLFSSFGGTLEPSFEDIAFTLGATVHRPYTGGETMPSTAWHAEFGDVNNDSFIDLLVVKGNVEGMIDFAAMDPNNLLIGTGRGDFEEGAPEAGFVTFERGRGGALEDLNLDGLLDVVVVNREAPVEIWRNMGGADSDDSEPGAMGAYLSVQLTQPGANRHGVGAWIEVKGGAHLWRQELVVGGGHASGAAGWTHFGLGTAERVEIRVQWPDGQWGPWLRVFTNQHLIIDRFSSTPRYWVPPPEALPIRAAQ